MSTQGALEYPGCPRVPRVPSPRRRAIASAGALPRCAARAAVGRGAAGDVGRRRALRLGRGRRRSGLTPRFSAVRRAPLVSTARPREKRNGIHPPHGVPCDEAHVHVPFGTPRLASPLTASSPALRARATTRWWIRHRVGSPPSRSDSPAPAPSNSARSPRPTSGVSDSRMGNQRSVAMSHGKDGAARADRGAPACTRHGVRPCGSQ